MEPNGIQERPIGMNEDKMDGEKEGGGVGNFTVPKPSTIGRLNRKNPTGHPD